MGCMTFKIPKVMSFFWSDSPMSWLRYLTLKSFRVLNPDWEMKLYTCATTDSVAWRSKEVHDQRVYTGLDYFPLVAELGVQILTYIPPIKALLPPAHACDICQWDVLRTAGGFYSDMDILYMKPFNYEKCCNFDVVYCLSIGYMTIGFFGASPNNPMFNEVYTEAIKSYNRQEYQTAGADAILRIVGIKRIPNSGTAAMNRVIQTYPHLDFAQLKDQVIYPWPWNKLDSLWSMCKPIPVSTTGIHWFGGTPLSQGMNLILTPSTVYNIPCTMTNAILANPLLVG